MGDELDRTVGVEWLPRPIKLVGLGLLADIATSAAAFNLGATESNPLVTGLPWLGLHHAVIFAAIVVMNRVAMHNGLGRVATAGWWIAFGFYAALATWNALNIAVLASLPR